MKVKVCNFNSRNFQKDLIESVLGTGFAVLTQHGIEDSLIKNVQQEWRTFFLEGQEIKNVFINEKDGNLGYKGMGTETAVGATKADLKEFYHWRPGKKIPSATKENTNEMFLNLDSIGNRILLELDYYNKSEGQETNYADNAYNSPNTLLRTLYYPAMDFDAQPGAVRAAAHEDINYITLLVAATSPGLEVKDSKGNWHAIPHEENSIVMNIGDMLQLESQGKYKSTTHRVVNPSNSRQDRISMPLFVHPHGDVQLSKDKTAQQYLNERIAEIYGNK